MATLFDPHFQALDVNGRPYSGATLTFLRRGTTTELPSYQDAAATTPHTIPVEADASGLFPPIYLPDGSYKCVLKTAAGVTVDTIPSLVVWDGSAVVPEGAWDSEGIYGIGALVFHDGYMFVSLVADNEDNEPDATTPGDTTEWMFVGAADYAALAEEQAGYAEEWAQSDDPVSVPAGGNGTTDKSSKAWAAESEASAAVSSGAMSALVIAENTFATVSTAEAWEPVAAPDYIRTSGYAAAGDGGGALYKKVVSEPAHAGKFSITLDDAVTVVWYEYAEYAINVLALGADPSFTGDSATAFTNAVEWVRLTGATSALTGDAVGRFGSRPIRVPFGRYKIGSTVTNASSVRSLHIVADSTAFICGDTGETDKSITLFDINGCSKLLVEGIFFNNADTAFEISSANIDQSRWVFERCDWSYCNVGVDTVSYAECRSTILTFSKCQFSNGVIKGGKIYTDLVRFVDCWYYSTQASIMFDINGSAMVEGGAFVAAGGDGPGRAFFHLTKDGDEGGESLTRRIDFYTSRLSNEGDSCVMVLNDLEPGNDLHSNPAITFTNCSLAIYHPEHYEDEVSAETGVVQLNKYPGIISFVGCTFLGGGYAATHRLVGRNVGLSGSPKKFFQITLDETSYRNAQASSSETSGAKLFSDEIRGYVNNPDPYTFRGMRENGYLPVVAATSSGVFKASFKVFTGYNDADYMTPVCFLLTLTGQGRNSSNNIGYAGASLYVVTVMGGFGSALYRKLSYTKLHGGAFGISDGSDADIVSMHFGTAETGTAEVANAANETDITVVFGTDMGFGNARISLLTGKENRYGRKPAA